MDSDYVRVTVYIIRYLFSLFYKFIMKVIFCRYIESNNFAVCSSCVLNVFLISWGTLLLIKPCMERFTEEKLKTKREKSEGGSKQIDYFFYT